MTPYNFCCLKKLLSDNCGCVVVSAIGKESPADTKVTDLLKLHFDGNVKAWSKIESKFKKLVEVNSVDVDVEALLFDAKSRSKKFGLAHCLSLGEELTAKIAAKYLNCDYIEAADCVRFQKGKLCRKGTLDNLQSAFGGVKRGVIGGFYGADNCERQVFSRGGGDVTGALCAIATHSTLYENWTDVNGVCKANPKLIPNVATILNLSYAEMYALAKGGAQVLHPSAVRHAERFGVPIRVANYQNECAACTLVGNCPSDELFLGIAEKVTSQGVVATLLHKLPISCVAKCLDNAFASLENTQNFLDVDYLTYSVTVNYCKISRNVVEICTSNSILPLLYANFAAAEVLTDCLC